MAQSLFSLFVEKRKLLLCVALALVAAFYASHKLLGTPLPATLVVWLFTIGSFFLILAGFLDQRNREK